MRGQPIELVNTRRDLRVDFFRGLALWWIFVDHVPDDWFSTISLRNFALCDATEVFVLLAGFGSGIAYGGVMDRNGWLYAAADAIKRAWSLYIAHIFLFVVFSAQVAYSATALDRGDFLEEIHLDVMADAPYRALFEALILRFQPAFLNILPMYIVLLLLFALAMPLLRRRWLLLGLSATLYAGARLSAINLPSWTGGGWFFNPLTWQVLFAIGAVLAYAPPSLPPRRAARAIDAAALAYLVFGLILIYGIWPDPARIAGLPDFVGRALFGIDKTGLHPARLLAILALAWFVIRYVPAEAGWLRTRPARLLALIGQHSLPVFCFGIFAAFLGRLLIEYHAGAAMQLAVNGFGLISLIGVGALAAWYREKGRDRLRGQRGAPVIGGVALALWLVTSAGTANADPVPDPPALEAGCLVDDTILTPDEPLPATARAIKAHALDILAIGSATTVGSAPGLDQPFPTRLVTYLRRALPGVRVSITLQGSRGLSAAGMVELLHAQLARRTYPLVLWQTGTVEAVHNARPDRLADTLSDGAQAVRDAGGDLVLIDPQFSRFLRTNADMDAYEQVFRATAGLPGITQFRRFDIMQDWVSAGRIDLEHSPNDQRAALLVHLHDCLGQALARFVLLGAALPSG